MLRRCLLIGLALLVVAGIAAPFIHADRYGRQIQDALQRGLNRKVEIGAVHFNLFTGPGFTVKDVVIHEDPALGIEPFAHMDELEARVRLSSLLTGRLDFSTLHFVSPSVNIVRPETGTWNVVRLLQSAKGAASVPEIQISDGRFYLKTGNTKSAFYISAADMTVTPRRDGLGIQFSGEPARTDRSARTAGSITGQGTLINGALDLDIELENSPVDELGGLLRGRRLEYHGSVSSRAKVNGPLSNLKIAGSFNLADVHRWDLTTDHNRSWTVDYKGAFDSATQIIDIATVNSPNQLHLTISGLLTRPQWALDVAVNELPASTLVSVAKDLGAPMPRGVDVDGAVVGTLIYGSESGLEGELYVRDASVKLQDGPELKLAEASLRVTGDAIRLAPAALVGEGGQGAQLEGEYNTATRTLDAKITGQGLRLLSRAAVPLVTRFSGGRWSAALQYHQSAAKPGVWSGSFDVRDTTTRVPGLTEPLRIQTARLEIDGEAIRMREMRANAGPVEFYGRYAYVPGDSRPHQFDLTVPQADLADMEQLLAPALRRSGNFFARTLRLRRATMPEWLHHRNAEGQIRIGSLVAGETIVRGLRSRVIWDAGVVQLASLQGRVDDGSFKGSGSIDITRSEPQYKFQGKAQNIAWKEGKVDLDGSIATLGSGLELLLSLRGEGTFTARGVVLSPEQVVRTATGAFVLSLGRAGPQFQLTDVEAAFGTERFTGDGSTQADGRLQMELASANRTMRVTIQ